MCIVTAIRHRNIAYARAAGFSHHPPSSHLSASYILTQQNRHSILTYTNDTCSEAPLPASSVGSASSCSRTTHATTNPVPLSRNSQPPPPLLFQSQLTKLISQVCCTARFLVHARSPVTHNSLPSKRERIRLPTVSNTAFRSLPWYNASRR